MLRSKRKSNSGLLALDLETRDVGLQMHPTSVLYVTTDTYWASILRLLNRRYQVIACAYFDIPGGVVTMTVKRESTILYAGKIFLPLSRSSAILRLVANPIILAAYAVVLSIFLRFKAKRSFDVCIAAHFLLGLCAILLRCMGIVKKMVYWATDWFPQARTTRKSFLNTNHIRSMVGDLLFLYADRLNANLADSVWNLTHRIAEARLKKWRGQLKVTHQRVVYPPLTQKYLDRDSVACGEPEKRIVFFGNLREERGLEPVIDAIANLSEHGIQVDFLIIGRGKDDPNYANRILKRAVDKGVINNIKVLGFLPIEEVRQILCTSLVGIALFEGRENVSNFAFPAKVVHYLESGIPIVVSKDSPLATEVVSNGIGFVTEYNAIRIQQVLDQMLSDIKLVRKLKANVREYVLRMASGESLYNAIESILYPYD